MPAFLTFRLPFPALALEIFRLEVDPRECNWICLDSRLPNKFKAYLIKELEVEKQLPCLENPPFDLSKVHDKITNIETLVDLTSPGGAMKELMEKAVERILKAE